MTAWLTPDDVAAELQVSVRTARRVIHECKHQTRGRSLTISDAELARYIRANTHWPTPTLPDPPHPCVYFIRCAEGGAIKIGYSMRSAWNRLESLQTGSPFELGLVAAAPAPSPRLEWQLHQRWAQHRLRGEWFSPNADLRDFLARTVLYRGPAWPEMGIEPGCVCCQRRFA